MRKLVTTVCIGGLLCGAVLLTGARPTGTCLDVGILNNFTGKCAPMAYAQKDIRSHICLLPPGEDNLPAQGLDGRSGQDAGTLLQRQDQELRAKFPGYRGGGIDRNGIFLWVVDPDSDAYPMEIGGLPVHLHTAPDSPFARIGD